MVRSGLPLTNWFADVVFVEAIPAFAYNERGIGESRSGSPDQHLERAQK
jgi:hypothetical protein